MLLTFLIEVLKVIFKRLNVGKKIDFFRVTTLWLIIYHPVWDLNRDFKPIGRYEKVKYVVFNKTK